MAKMFRGGTLSDFFLRYKSLLKKDAQMWNQIHESRPGQPLAVECGN